MLSPKDIYHTLPFMAMALLWSEMCSSFERLNGIIQFVVSCLTFIHCLTRSGNSPSIYVNKRSIQYSSHWRVIVRNVDHGCLKWGSVKFCLISMDGQKMVVVKGRFRVGFSSHLLLRIANHDGKCSTTDNL